MTDRFAHDFLSGLGLGPSTTQRAPIEAARIAAQAVRQARAIATLRRTLRRLVAGEIVPTTALPQHQDSEAYRAGIRAAAAGLLAVMDALIDPAKD